MLLVFLLLIAAGNIDFGFMVHSETTLTHNVAFLAISMHLFTKIYITRMSGMLFLMFMQSLFQFEAKVEK